MKYDVLVVGGGASGLVAAVFAARAGATTAILEHKDKIGKKILATGNGKCNYTNFIQTAECYRGTHPDFAEKILKSFNEKDTIEFFQKLGIYPKVKNNYVYPYSEQAASMVQVLAMELRRLKVSVYCNEHVEQIKKVENQGFHIQTKERQYVAGRVILATGGCASPAHGSDGSGYALSKSFGHKIIKPMPALTQLHAEGNFFKTITGVRLEAKVTLKIDGNIAATEMGEVLFTNYGISGIPVFQISRYAANGLERKKTVRLYLDFYPDVAEQELRDMITDRFRNGAHKSTEEVMTGLLNQKLAFVLLKEANLKPEESSARVDAAGIKRMTHLLKEFQLKITDTNGFENAQVSAGGVDTTEIDEVTLESKLVPHLYITGELLDIDGTCGGYNLQWAWSTGAVAGRSCMK